MNSLCKQAEGMGLNPFRIYLAESLYTKYKGNQEELFWFLLHLAEQAGRGHIRTDLGKIAEEIPEWYEDEKEPDLPLKVSQAKDAIIEKALECGLIGQLKEHDSTADELLPPRPPLLLSSDGNFLYFLRRRRDEDRLIAALKERTAGQKNLPDDKPQSPQEHILQCLKNGKRLVLLSGGPGTGKTYTVSKLLELLDQEAAEDRPFSTILCAPTGMAASRMAESLQGRNGSTLHALLGIHAYGRPKFHAGNRLDADLVVVDEASMVDLQMMKTLLEALAPETALLLVGDPDQLPSVEAGALLGDMLFASRESASNDGGPLMGSVIKLTEVHRSNQDVLQAADAVREGDMDAFMSALNGDSLCLKPLGKPEEAAQIFAERYRGITKGTESFTVLSPLRRGPWGTLQMNQMISRKIGNTTAPFSGMPVVVTRNDPSRSLWNGQRALVEKEGAILACFSEGGRERRLPLSLLPGWETAWIQTVHKSQGSEFDSIAIVLPQAAEKMLCREILYTALTRAKDSVRIYADETVLKTALSKNVVRNSRIQHWAAGL